MDDDRSIAENLKVARDYMREHGMCKGLLENYCHQVCMKGALNYVLTGDPLNWPHAYWTNEAPPETRVLALVIKEQWPDRSPGNVASFNNHPDTTPEDVDLCFDKAILSLGGSLI